jgi:hypothetical protein
MENADLSDVSKVFNEVDILSFWIDIKKTIFFNGLFLP